MKYMMSLQAAVLLSAAFLSSAQAGLPDHVGCQKPIGCGDCSCEPCVMVCVGECKTVKEEKTCFEVDCEHVCIPPVKLPSCSLGNCGLGRLCGLGGGCIDLSCGGCGDAGCAECCGDSCGSCDNGGGDGLFSKICDKLSGCRIRPVRKLRKESREVEKVVVEWRVEHRAIGGCGDTACGKCCSSCAAPASCCAPCGF